MPDGFPRRLADLFRLPEKQPDRRPLSSMPLSETNPRIAMLRDLMGGFTGMLDPLAPEATPATGVGAIGSLLPLVGMMGGLKRIASPIKAYHGSPHDFEAFDLSKIGTGEGAQAYGHGLYFAENPNVASDYREALSTAKVTVGGQEFPVPSWSGTMSPQPRVIRRLADKRAKYPKMTDAEVVAEVRKDIESDLVSAFRADAANPAEFNNVSRQQEILDTMVQRGLEVKPAGKTYEVAIHAEPEEFLDWDLPLSQQSAKVKEAVRKTFGSQGSVEPVRLRDGTYGVTQVQPDGSGRLVAGVSPQETPEQALKAFDEYLHSGTGMSAYWELGRSAFNRDPAKASEALKAAGIKGIRYLDQGSRGGRAAYRGDQAYLSAAASFKSSGQSPEAALAGLEQAYKGAKRGELQAAIHEVYDITPQTRNFVVFDDEIIDIAKKYGIALPAAAALVEQQRRERAKAGKAAPHQ